MILYPLKYLFVHETAVSYLLNPDQWVQTERYHRDERKFPASSLNVHIGYNYEINAYGGVRMARVEGEETCAVLGFNKRSVSICLDGDFSELEKPTLAQINSIVPLMISIITRHNIPITNVLPHRASYDLLGQPRSKTCYGSGLSDTWAQDLIKNWKGTVPPLGKKHEDFEC